MTNNKKTQQRMIELMSPVEQQIMIIRYVMPYYFFKN